MQMVIVTNPSKPFEYTAKGTPRRQATLNAYSEEIDAAYNAVEESSQTELLPPIVWTAASTLDYVRSVVRSVLPLEDVIDAQDLFDQGLDRYARTKYFFFTQLTWFPLLVSR